MSRRARIGIQVAFGMLALAFVYRFKGDLAAIELREPTALVTATLCLLGTMVVGGLFNKVFFGAFGARMTWREWLGLAFVGALGNLLAPLRGGTVSNAVYLKKKFDLSYSDFVSSLAASYVWAFLVNAGLGIAALLYVGDGAEPFATRLVLVVFSGIFICFAAVAIFAPRWPEGRTGPTRFVFRALNSWRQIQTQPGLMWGIGGLTIANAVLQTAIYHELFRAVGIEIAFVPCMLLAAFATFASLVNVMPANLGVRETFAAASAWLVQAPVAQTVMVSFIERFILFGLTAVFGLYFGSVLLKLLGGVSNPASTAADTAPGAKP